MSRPLFEIVTRVPHSVAGLILADCLTIKDICKLDSAFCRKELRASFLKILSSKEIVYPEIPSSVNSYANIPDLIKWLSAKGILMFCIGVTPEIPTDLLSTYTMQTAHLMRRISVYNFQREGGNLSSLDVVAPILAKRCPNNVSLEFSYCDFVPEIKECLLSQGDLRQFLLKYCKFITPEIFSGLRLPKMEALSLIYSDVEDDVVLAAISCFTNLRFLNLAGCGELSNDAVLAIAHHCPKLKRISLNGQTSITDDAVVKLAQCCSALTVVDIGGCSALTDRSVEALAANCPCLDRLYLANNELLTDSSLHAVCEHLSDKVDVLDIAGCPLITANVIVNTLHKCTNLTVLYIDRDESDDLLRIIEKCGNLEKLLIGGPVQAEDILAISQHCRKLFDLGLPDCLNTNAEQSALATLIVNCPQLEILVLPSCCHFVSTFLDRLLQSWRPNLLISNNKSEIGYDIMMIN